MLLVEIELDQMDRRVVLVGLKVVLVRVVLEGLRVVPVRMVLDGKRTDKD